MSVTEQWNDLIRARTLEARNLSRGWPQNATSGAYEASRVAMSGPGRLFGFSGYSSKGAAQFILVFDASALPAEGATAVLVVTVAATAIFSAYFGSIGRWFEKGIVLCNSSTSPTKTIGSADTFFDVQVM